MVLHRKRRLRLTAQPGGGYTEHDLRFRVWHQEPQLQERPVLLALLDASGSREEEAKQIACLFYGHMLALTEQIYWRVGPVFIIHHTEAEEVSGVRFFTKSSEGGTKFSSAYRLAAFQFPGRFRHRNFDYTGKELRTGDYAGKHRLYEVITYTDPCWAFILGRLPSGGRVVVNGPCDSSQRFF